MGVSLHGPKTPQNDHWLLGTTILGNPHMAHVFFGLRVAFCDELDPAKMKGDMAIGMSEVKKCSKILRCGFSTVLVCILKCT